MSYKINAFPLTQNGTQKTTGTFLNPIEVIFLCAVSGDLTVTWQDDTTTAVTCIEGNAYMPENAKKVVITTGTFHVK